MLVKEFIKLRGLTELDDITFVKARARKDANTKFYHTEYQTTPIMSPEKCGKLLDYIVLNDQQPPIEWAGGQTWTNWFKSGRLTSLLVISKEDLLLLYHENQANDLIAHIDKAIYKNLK